MPGFEFVIESYGHDIIDRHLLRFAENVESPRHALEAVATDLREITEDNFATEGGHASGGWKRLTPERVAYKAKHGLDPHILRATDRLMRSLTRKFDAQHIERLTGDSLVFGSSVRYGVYHQSPEPRTKMPYRPPVALTQSDKKRLVRTVQAALIEGAYASGHKAVWGS